MVFVSKYFFQIPVLLLFLLVAAKNKTNPRGVYKNHLDELKALMEKGVGKYDAENMQKYNEGSTLGPKE